MTRVAAWIGVLLGAASVAAGAVDWSVLSAVWLVGAGAVVALSALGTLRGKGPAHIAMLVGALALLAGFMPVYFRQPAVWPTLLLIALAVGTFGFGTLGFLLDRYQPGSAHRSL